LEDFIETLDRKLRKVCSSAPVVPVFLGVNPPPEILNDDWITDKPRYKRLARWQSRMQDVEIEGHNLGHFMLHLLSRGFTFTFKERILSTVH
jgi:hypothetical protein